MPISTNRRVKNNNFLGKENRPVITVRPDGFTFRELTYCNLKKKNKHEPT
jgi:hypothetical protein